MNFLLPLSASYPGFQGWFVTKVLPNVGTTSQISVMERYGEIIAVGIAKNEGGEKKLCTVRVAPAYIGRGYGLRLMDNLLDWMDTDQPIATVSEEKMPDFERIFAHYGFRLTSVNNGLYRPGKVEFMFNQPKILLPFSK